MEISQVETAAEVSASDFVVSDDRIEAVLASHARASFDIADPEWHPLEDREISKRRLGLRGWLRRMLRRGRNAREQVEVRSGYETHWERTPTVEEYVAGLDDRVLAVRWRDRGMLLTPQGLRQTHLLYLMQAIKVLRPRRVLEVGCGNGNIVLTLAARFPEIAFAGIELTAAGIAAAKAVQAQPQLPESFIAASPEPLPDPTAHRNAELQTGNAGALPFADSAFDLVYTRLALEQMEQIRDQALSEVARVTGRAVVLIEPWRDFNMKDPGRAYVRRQGYFNARARHLEKYGFRLVLVSEDMPQKVQFNAGPVIAIR